MFSIFGSSGFIGSHLASYIETKGHSVQRMPRNILELSSEENLGHVIYCIGLTADFRNRPFDTIEAHVSLLSYLLKNHKFDSFLYLSSTRVYQGSQYANENSNLIVNPNNPGDIYNLSKLLGESICINCDRDKVKIARLSNVFGSGMPVSNFLYDITESVFNQNSLILRSSLNSAKDYLSIDETIRLLFDISTKGTQPVYNVASGTNTSTSKIFDILKKQKLFDLHIDESAEEIIFSEISTHRIASEFSFKATAFEDQYQKFLLEFGSY